MTSTMQLPESAPRLFSVSDETIERFLVDDLSVAERDVVRRTVESDAALRAYINAREADRRAFVIEAPRLALPELLRNAKPRARTLPMRLTAFAGAFAMACALVFMIVRDGDDTVRLKGGALPVDVVVRRDGRLFELAPGVTLRPGDALRIEVTSAQAGFVSAVLVDGRGASLVYEAVPIARGVSVLPDSLVLDDVTGAEALHVLFTIARPATGAMVEAVKHDPTRAGDARAVVSWHKEPRP